MKIPITDKAINKIVRRAMEDTIINHPPSHDTALAAEQMLGYFTTPKQFKKGMKRAKKQRKKDGIYE